MIRRFLPSCAILFVLAQPTFGAADIVAIERVVAADPENLRAAAEYRQLAIAAAAFDRPINLLETLARRKDAGPNVQINLALAYIDKVPVSGDIRRLYLGRDAVNALTKAIERQPSVLAYYLRGVINLFYNNLIFKRTPRGLDDLRSGPRTRDAAHASDARRAGVCVDRRRLLAPGGPRTSPRNLGRCGQQVSR